MLNKNIWISIKIWLKIVPKDAVEINSALLSVMAWHRAVDKPLSEPVIAQYIDAYMRHSVSIVYGPSRSLQLPGTTSVFWKPKHFLYLLHKTKHPITMLWGFCNER